MQLALTVPLWRKAEIQPRTVGDPGSKYVSRVYQLPLATTGNAAAILTLGALSTLLATNFASSFNFKILGISIWNTRLGGALASTVNVSNISTSTDTTINAKDYGSGTSLAATKLVLPQTIASPLLINTSSTTSLCAVSDPNAATGIVSNYCVQLTLHVSV
jgi:hypothetical protein